jgi:hypothetical protein
MTLGESGIKLRDFPGPLLRGRPRGFHENIFVAPFEARAGC